MQKPDALESAIRLGCGGLFGLVFGLWYAFRRLDFEGPALVGATVVSVVLCAWGAHRFGDRFWIGGDR